MRGDACVPRFVVDATGSGVAVLRQIVRSAIVATPPGQDPNLGARKSQAVVTPAEWRAFLAAIDATHGMGIAAPRYRDFVRVHIDGMTTAEGMRWGVHTMRSMGMIGRNFLAWHRQYLVQLERRLQQVNPSVTI